MKVEQLLAESDASRSLALAAARVIRVGVASVTSLLFV